METTQSVKTIINKNKRPNRSAHFSLQMTFILIFGLFLFMITLGILFFSYEAKYADKIYPHVSKRQRL